MIHRLYPLLLLALLLAITGCGDDNGTGPGEEEPPALPEMQNAQPDLSYFNQNPATNGDTSYVQAQSQVTGTSFLLSIGQLYSGYLESIRGEEATFEGGTWTWNFSDSYQNMSMDIEITAQEQDNATQWAMFWTFDDGEGNSYEDYRILDGEVRNDGAEGEWTFNALDENNEETPMYTSNWRSINDAEETITLEVFEENTTVVTIDFEKNEPEYTMIYDFSDDQENLEIYWNTETGNGYLIQGDVQQCWNETLQDVSCE